MILKLVVESKANSHPIELLLKNSSHGIGRMYDNDLSIQNDCVSGYHAELIQTPEGDYTVKDLNSSNGTFLNGTRISSRERVKAGDLLKVGNLKVAVEEHIENVTVSEDDSNSENDPLKIISLEEYFSIADEDEDNTYPNAPAGTPLTLRNTDEVPKETARTAEPVPESGKANENKEAEPAREVEQAKVERPKKLAETIHEDFRSEIQMLTSALDKALKEINRLKAIDEPQFPMQDEIDGQAAETAKLKLEIAQGHEDNAALRSEIIHLRDKFAESEHRLLENSQDNARAENNTIYQLQQHITETESAAEDFEKVKKTLTQSNLSLQQQLEAAKVAGQKSAGHEANLRQNNADLVEKVKKAEGNSAKLAVQIKEKTSSISKNEKLIKKLQQQLTESESRSESGRKLKARLNSAERMQLTAEAQVSQLQKKLGSIGTEAQAVKEQLGTSEKNCSELEEELARSIKIRNESEKVQDDLRIQLNHRNSNIADLVKCSEELEFKFKETDREKAQIHTDLQLTNEGLSEALHSTDRRLADANRNLNVEIYLREAAEKQLREAAAALKSKHSGPETLALSSADTNLNRISHLIEEKSEDDESSGKASKEKKTDETGSFSEEEFFRQLIAKLDLVDSFTQRYENKWSYSKVAQQFALLKHAFVELLEDHSVSQFYINPETSLCMKHKNRVDPAPREDGTLPKINYSFSNSQVVETLCPGYIFRDGSREVIIRKATVVVK